MHKKKISSLPETNCIWGEKDGIALGGEEGRDSLTPCAPRSLEAGKKTDIQSGQKEREGLLCVVSEGRLRKGRGIRKENHSLTERGLHKNVAVRKEGLYSTKRLYKRGDYNK